LECDWFGFDVFMDFKGKFSYILEASRKFVSELVRLHYGGASTGIRASKVRTPEEKLESELLESCQLWFVSMWSMYLVLASQMDTHLEISKLYPEYPQASTLSSSRRIPIPTITKKPTLKFKKYAQLCKSFVLRIYNFIAFYISFHL